MMLVGYIATGMLVGLRSGGSVNSSGINCLALVHDGVQIADALGQGHGYARDLGFKLLALCSIGSDLLFEDEPEIFQGYNVGSRCVCPIGGFKVCYAALRLSKCVFGRITIFGSFRQFDKQSRIPRNCISSIGRVSVTGKGGNSLDQALKRVAVV